MCVAILESTQAIWLPTPEGPWKGWPCVNLIHWTDTGDVKIPNPVLILRTHRLNPFPRHGDPRLPNIGGMLVTVYLVLTSKGVVGFIPESKILEMIGTPPPVSEVGFDGLTPSRMSHDDRNS